MNVKDYCRFDWMGMPDPLKGTRDRSVRPLLMYELTAQRYRLNSESELSVSIQDTQILISLKGASLVRAWRVLNEKIEKK